MNTRTGLGATHLDVARWLGWCGLALAGIGYWGPWIRHGAVALMLLGLDLGEFVKFLPQVRSGAIALQREGFYLPVIALSVTLTITAFRRDRRPGWKTRGVLSAIAIGVSLAMLPPAWSPASLQTAEFRLQTALIAACVIAALAGPILGLLPRHLLGGIMILLAALAAIVPLWQFVRILPAVQVAYGRPLTIGWGPAIMVIGWLLLILAEGIRLLQPRRGSTV
ncbi:MAG: hypothetical protein IT330_17755 [Anaerolineae bacterium]|nr:hypothetical protein [Anaerolineae bacterium]